MSTSDKSHQPFLTRGAACSSCRILKVRCDAQKPICGPCKQRKHSDDCEWIGIKGKSEAHKLEEQIRGLEEQIVQLRTSKEGRSSASSKDGGSSASVITDLTSESLTQSDSSGHDGWWHQEEPPIAIRASLIDLFLAQASELGFFLSPQRFRHSALRSKPWGHKSRPSPFLLSVVYLCGIFVSRSKPLKRHELEVLGRVVKLRNIKSSHSHPRQETHAIQAEILLSRYYVATGKMVEALWSASSALSIASALRLHKIRSKTEEPCRLPPPKDILEEGERIHGFWAVVQNDFGLGPLLDKKPNFMDDAKYGNQADTPWPIPLENYVYWTDRESGSRTFLNFLGGAKEAFDPTDCFETRNMKATITLACCQMFGLKVRRGDQFTPEALLKEFNHLTPYLDAFFAAYKPQTSPPLSRSEVGLLTRIYGATVFIYNVYATDPKVSRTKKVEASLKALKLITGQTLPYSFIDPHLTAVWMLSVKVLCEEIGYLKEEEENQDDKDRIDEIVDLMEKALAAIQKFEPSIPLLAVQLSLLRELIDETKSAGESSPSEDNST